MNKQFPVLPPSTDFAAYLISHYHAHRMNAARQAMLGRMRNFHSTEVYPAISEALGVIAALGEFYGGDDGRGLVGQMQGDPSERRSQLGEGAANDEITLVNGTTLQPQQVRVLRLLSDGVAREPRAILEAVGSKANGSHTIKASFRNLRSAVAGSGIVLESDENGLIYIPKPCCILVRVALGMPE